MQKSNVSKQNQPTSSFLNLFTEWISRDFSAYQEGSHLFNAFVLFLNKNDFQTLRANIGTKTLHPQVDTINHLWFPKATEDILRVLPQNRRFSRKTVSFPGGDVIETRWFIGNIMTEIFQSSPIALALRTKEPYRYLIAEDKNRYKESSDYPYSVLPDLIALGATDYIVIPVLFPSQGFVYLSFATKRKGGFTEEQIQGLKTMAPLFGGFWERYVLKELPNTLLRLYLGKHTGPLVSSGKILRGEAESINAVIWFSDIRKFTEISERLSGENVIELLNVYFETVIPEIERSGGEVLKMIGDSVLAIFPFDKNVFHPRLRAVATAKRISKELAKSNLYLKEKGFPSIQHGIGLHTGKVLYGNIGSAERMDFTVIGSAVNLASRISSLCGKLDFPVLASQEFTKGINLDWKELGNFKLKGIENEIDIYGFKLES